MLSIERIRQDLKDIRYYYARKEVFDKAQNSVGKLAMSDKIEMYNNAICLASPRLYDLYVSLYLENNTQDSLSDRWGYTFEHISRLNTQLVKFLQQNIVEKEAKQDA